MTFRDRLIETLRAMGPVLAEPGVLVAGSEVPNLLEPGLASTLVVSQDLDIAVSVYCHAAVKAALQGVSGYHPSPEEPSVWLPDDHSRLEVNFIGFEPGAGLNAPTYVLEDPDLPLLVFGHLAGWQQGSIVELDDLRIPLPRPVDLLLEKLSTDRSAIKGERDLLVALALLILGGDDLVEQLLEAYVSLPRDLRHVVRSNLTILSLLRTHRDMPDPEAHRARVAALAARLAALDQSP